MGFHGVYFFGYKTARPLHQEGCQLNRIFLAFATVFLVSNAILAGPLPWSFDIRFQAAGSSESILLGSEPGTGGSGSPWYATYPTGSGLTRTGSQTDTGQQTLYSFGYGDWALSQTPPGNAANGAFDLIWAFSSTNGQTANGIASGGISAGGFFTSGTGNFSISLNETREVSLGGQRARIEFAASNGESASRIEMTVTELPPLAETPEPATLLLAGIGLAGVGLRRWRRK